ncbi:DUF3322 domain-containing protein [Massilia sp. UYP11]|uniref:DUF3322 domain-containing protein n=1 Tax=Massilia sp. UYP11 TaxID=1756385 RepID=UPI003D1C6E7A
MQGLRSCIDGADQVKRHGVGSVRAAHDRPGCAGSRQVRARGIYLRQVDIPGVDTKFIEARKRLIAELLDQVLPAESIDAGAVGARQLETRYGLLGKPAQNARCRRIVMGPEDGDKRDLGDPARLTEQGRWRHMGGRRDSTKSKTGPCGRRDALL